MLLVSVLATGFGGKEQYDPETETASHTFHGDVDVEESIASASVIG